MFENYRMHAYVSIYFSMHTYACIYFHVHAYIPHMHAYISYMHMHTTDLYAHVCMHMHAYACICMHTKILKQNYLFFAKRKLFCFTTLKMKKKMIPGQSTTSIVPSRYWPSLINQTSEAGNPSTVPVSTIAT